MGGYRTPAPVKLVIGILAHNAQAADQAMQHLQKEFGEPELILNPFLFSFTNYYVDELGDAPVRAFIAFEELINRERIVAIKRHTNDLELQWASENGTPNLRPVNLDPGYMTLGQFFLATTKDQRQRVYISDGIFVEPTLYFQNGHFNAFPWTYNDYQSPEYVSYLEKVRQRLAHQHTTGKPYQHRKKPSDDAVK